MDIFRAYEVGYGHARYGQPRNPSVCESDDQRRWYGIGYGTGHAERTVVRMALEAAADAS